MSTSSTTICAAGGSRYSVITWSTNSLSGNSTPNDEIIKSLNVGNAGGIRLCAPGKEVVRAAIMTAGEVFTRLAAEALQG